jgi:ankyrin repeat protein
MFKNRRKNLKVNKRKSLMSIIGYLLIMALSVNCIGWQGKSFYLKATRLKSLDKDPIPSPMHPFDPRGFRGTYIWPVVRLVYLYDVDGLEEMLSQKKYNLNEPSLSGFTVLSMAILASRKEMIPILLKYGADPNQTSNEKIESPMHYASVRDPDILKVLLDHGGNPNLPMYDDDPTPSKWNPLDTPLSLAATKGLRENVELLLKAGGDVNYGNGRAVNNSLTHFHLDITLLLLQNGFDFSTELSEPVENVKWTIERKLQYVEGERNALVFNERDFNRVVKFLEEKGIKYQHVEPRKNSWDK